MLFSLAPIEKRAEDEAMTLQSATANAELCRGGPSRLAGSSVYCLKGSLDSTSAESFSELASDISVLVVDSYGGNTRATMRIARLIYDNDIDVIIEGQCFSSCANYILPAASGRLTVLPGSFIGLHGSPPRDHFRFVESYLSQQGLSKEDIRTDPNLYFGIVAKFANHIENEIIPEVEFFAHVLVPETYLTRFTAISRAAHELEDEICSPKRGVMLVVGPSYLEAVRIRTRYFWWPENTDQIFNVIGDYKSDYSVIVDGDSYLSWSLGTGALQPGQCSFGEHL
ncbi:hypothetical protein [Brevundimonas sp.]|uniref:hypothetical protein n=1 Tax=Brevundimonas sp. TaxID=1871086 RepID=UPI0035694FE9